MTFCEVIARPGVLTARFGAYNLAVSQSVGRNLAVSQSAGIGTVTVIANNRTIP